MDVQVVKEAARDRKYPGSRHKPYPKEVKEFVIMHAKEALAAGETINSLSRSLDISPNTLIAWISPNGNKEPAPRGRPSERIRQEDRGVDIQQTSISTDNTESADTRKFRLVVRGNTAEYVVENLTRDDVIAILRELSY